MKYSKASNVHLALFIKVPPDYSTQKSCGKAYMEQLAKASSVPVWIISSTIPYLRATRCLLTTMFRQELGVSQRKTLKENNARSGTYSFATFDEFFYSIL